MRSATGSARRALRSSSAAPSVPVATTVRPKSRNAPRVSAGPTSASHATASASDCPDRTPDDQMVDQIGPRRRAAAAAGDPRAVTSATGAVPRQRPRRRPERPPARSRPTTPAESRSPGGTDDDEDRGRHPLEPGLREPSRIRSAAPDRDAPVATCAATASGETTSSNPAPSTSPRAPSCDRLDRRPELAQRAPASHRSPAGVPPRSSNSRVASIAPSTTVSGRRHDLDDAPMAGALEFGVHDEVDARRDGRHARTRRRCCAPPAAAGSRAWPARRARCWRGSSTSPAARC